GLSDILIRKDKQRITVDIFTARPGIVIGKSGVEVDALRRELHAITKKNVHININEIKRPELDAKLVAQSIAEQLENRVSFRRGASAEGLGASREGGRRGVDREGLGIVPRRRGQRSSGGRGGPRRAQAEPTTPEATEAVVEPETETPTVPEVEATTEPTTQPTTEPTTEPAAETSADPTPESERDS